MTILCSSRSTLSRVLALSAVLALAAGCGPAADGYRDAAVDPALLHGAVLRSTEAMLEAVTSPPVSARTYAYASIAAREAMRGESTDYPSFVGRLNGLTDVPSPAAGTLLPLAGVHAYLTVAEALVFAPERVAAYRDSIQRRLLDDGMPEEVLAGSAEYGAAVGKHVLAWAGADGIKKARASGRLEIRNEAGLWIPTPPAYFDAVEPNWAMLRPFVLDTASQFAPAAHAPFDLGEGSDFRRQAMEVYQVGKTLTPEQRLIAAFWDCNPFAVQSQGHVVTSAKKISPGGHWLGITGQALRASEADMLRAADAYARVSIALADGFISVWDEKFRSVRVRPVTVIQQHIDPTWQPLLQTPPFPEYPSGHSVISSAAAEVLTDLFGDGFAFRDSTEMAFGLPPRDFSSFRQAAQEAALSRLFGGIHYRDGIENGLVQGRAIGQRVNARLSGEALSLAVAR